MTFAELPTELLLLFHVLLAVVWLGCDFVVFWLSLSLLNREIPALIRADRAHVAEVIDRYVLISMVLMMPCGVLLAYVKGWPLMATPWLTLKLAVFGIIVLLAIILLTGASGTLGLLKKLAAGAGDAEELEAQVRKNVVGLAPAAIAIHLSLIAVIFIALTRGMW